MFTFTVATCMLKPGSYCAACKLDFKVTIKKEIRNCNSAMYLSKKRIIYLALSDDDEECNIEDVSVCNAMQNVFTNKGKAQASGSTSLCRGRLACRSTEGMPRTATET